MKPLCIDLFCGLGGWAEGFLAEGFDVVGFDNGHTAPYASGAEYPGQLVIQDVLTLHGSQFRNASVIVASPPCQNYSYLAMPWSRSVDYVRPDGDGWEVLNSAVAKEMREKWEREGPDNRLFDACFRIQREAIEATQKTCAACNGTGVEDDEDDFGYTCGDCGGLGWTERRYIPLIVENVRGAIPWVGRSAWNYGSFHLWGDVPALMPFSRSVKVLGFRFDGSDKSFQSASVESTGKKGLKVIDRTGEVPDGTGNSSWFFQGKRRDPRDIRRDEQGDWATIDGTKIGGDWLSDPNSTCRKHGSRSSARKLASAQIAKIPLPLAQHIAVVYKPRKPLAQGGRLHAAGSKSEGVLVDAAGKS